MASERYLLRDMIATIKAEARAAAPWVGDGEISVAVLEAMAKVARHEFVPAEIRYAAYDDNALPIGHGQTISQPYIVALMTQLLQPQPDHRILEIGTGSGYQAAVLSTLVQKIHSIEIVPALAEAAAQRLRRLGYANVEVHCADGRLGWPQAAPYDGIIVTAAPEQVPPALIEQLVPGGRLVIPLGSHYGAQDLCVLEKDGRGEVEVRKVLPVAFVPLVAEAERER